MAGHLTWSFKRTLGLIKRLDVNFKSLSHHRMRQLTAATEYTFLTKINEDVPINDFQEYKRSPQWGSNNLRDSLMKLLDITRERANRTIVQYPKFCFVPIKSIKRNFEILCDGGVLKSTILENQKVLTYDTRELRQKIRLMKSLNFELNECISLFNLSNEDLAAFEKLMKSDAEHLPNGNRIRYFSERFNKSIGEICSFLVYNPHILFMNVATLYNITEFFLESGIIPDHIMSDPVAYKYKLSMIKERVTLAKNLNVQPLRPWVIRCQARVIVKNIEQQSRVMNVPRNEKQENIIADLFKCDLEDVKIFLHKMTNYVPSTRFPKMITNMNLLHEIGYNIKHLQRAPQALLRKHETLQYMVEVWKKHGSPPIPISHFTFSREKFCRTIAVITKNKDKTSQDVP